jgi:N-formylglutamate deformylase
MTPVTVIPGDGPVVLGFPHVGTWLGDEIRSGLNSEGLLLRDTDWHVDELYAGLLPGSTMVRANFHRYAIDANRSPNDESLYPGQNTTGLVPLTDFDGVPIWRTEPGAAETAARLKAFHAPYHAALRAELDRVKARHGAVILFDCHSIRSRIPYLFEGRLPDLNIGTANGTSCAPAVEETARAACAAAQGFSHVVNGRFRGGWTTRHYGRPETGVHAIQMELAQASHLTTEAPPFLLSPEKSAALRPVLAHLLQALSELVPSLSEHP